MRLALVGLAATVCFVAVPAARSQSLLSTSPGFVAPADSIDRGTGDEFEDAIRRHEFERQRMAFPHETVRRGSFARAARYAHDSIPRFVPQGRSTMASPAWTSIGPDNVGGRINSIAVNPVNPNSIFIAAADGGVWKTDDEGHSWRSVFDDAPTQAMGALAIDSRDTTIMYAGTGEGNFAGDSYFGMGMFKSTDAGEHWFAISDTSFPVLSAVSQVVVDPRQSSIVYATVPYLETNVEGGLYRSTNGGQTWRRILTGVVHDVLVNPLVAGALVTAADSVTAQYPCSHHGIYRSTNGGITWTRDSLPGVNPLTMGRTTLAHCAAHPEVNYASVSQIAGARTPLLGLFKTTDGGANWVRIPVPIDYTIPQGSYDNILIVHLSDPNRVIAGGVRVIRSTDGGGTWDYVPVLFYNAGVVHSDQHAGACNALHPDTVYIGDDGGFYRGTAWGADWTKRSTGLRITQFTGGAMYPGNDAMRFGGTQDNGTIIANNSASFRPTLDGDGGFTAFHPTAPNVLFTEQYNTSLHRSDDFGVTWKRVINGLPANQSSLFYIPFAVSPMNGNTMYFPWIDVRQSTDRGENWKVLAKSSCLFPANGGSCYFYSTIGVSPFSDSIVMVGSTGGGVAVSMNAGATWSVLGLLPAAYTSSVHHSNRGKFYCTLDGFDTSGHVFAFDTTSKAWKNISGNLPVAPVNDLFVTGDTLVAGTLVGVFISTNDGATWARFGTGIPAVSVVQLLFNPPTGTLRAVTHGRGMFDIPFGQPAAGAPVFLSLPDTSIIAADAQFVYAPIVKANPPARFTITSSDASATVDSTIGVVRWRASSPTESITVHAVNGIGSTSQTFSLRVAQPPPLTDWHVVSDVQTSHRSFALRAVWPTTLWMTQDSGVVARSSDGGATWARWTLPDSLSYAAGLGSIDGRTVVAGTRGGSLYRTSDAGQTWMKVLTIPNSRWENVAFANASYGMAVSVGEHDTALVVVTTDAGQTWTPKPSHVRVLRPGMNTLEVLDEQHAWFAASNRESSPPGSGAVVRTTNGGDSWSTRSTECLEIAGIGFLDAQVGFIVDRWAPIIDKTTNGGATWFRSSIADAGADLIGVQAVRRTNSLWIVSNTHAWLTSDAGGHWSESSLIPMGPVVSAAFTDSSHGWAAGMNNVVEMIGPIPPVFVRESSAPASMVLDAYPNPFATVSRLEFAVDPVRTARVRLTLFDSYGRVARDCTPTIEHEEPGRIMATVDARELTAGAYIAVLQAGERLYRIPLLVVK